MYKTYLETISGALAQAVIRTTDAVCIPFDPANTDYQRFKLDLTNGAELQDADGNVMSEAQVQAFLPSLP